MPTVAVAARAHQAPDHSTEKTEEKPRDALAMWRDVICRIEAHRRECEEQYLSETTSDPYFPKHQE